MNKSAAISKLVGALETASGCKASEIPPLQSRTLVDLIAVPRIKTNFTQPFRQCHIILTAILPIIPFWMTLTYH